MTDVLFDLECDTARGIQVRERVQEYQTNKFFIIIVWYFRTDPAWFKEESYFRGWLKIFRAA
jgi:hypothetical protein